MGFSKETFEQYRREIRIMWRVLGVGALVAGSVHFFSLPFVSRLISVAPDSEPDSEPVPIELIVEEALVQQTPDEPEEPPEEEPEPAASAQRPSAAPLATSAEPVPTAEVAAADTVAVAPSVAAENGAIDGEGAVGDASVVGLVTPDIATLIGPERPIVVRDLKNEPVPEVSLAARRQPSSRRVSCAPCSIPSYPTTARREAIEGQPVVNVIFDGSGRVVEAVIEVSSGNAAFDRAALEEARRSWRFQDPEGLGGQVSVGVTYVIEGSQQYEEAQTAGEIRSTELPLNQQIRSIELEAAELETEPEVGLETESELEQTAGEDVLPPAVLPPTFELLESESSEPESSEPESAEPVPLESATPESALPSESTAPSTKPEPELPEPEPTSSPEFVPSTSEE
ncbi:MAG: energy transducer TonB [Cyanobacteria bacterium P01_D01_bin.105]